MYEVIKELLDPYEIPDFYQIHYQMPFCKVEDIQKTIRQELEKDGLIQRIAPDDRVAITAGSRLISNIVLILKTVVQMIQERGAQPYIVAAMGSHGGATAEGQREFLTGMGIVEEAVGCPVVSDMATEYVGMADNGLPVYIDRFAANCDKIVIVGRVKAHTDFHGPVESGLCKMIAIGLGKQYGADICHKLGFPAMSENVMQIARTVLKHKPVAFGLAILEDAFHNTAQLTAVASEHFLTEEPELLRTSKALMPRIPYDKIDILIVSQIGKNISGAGMDPNITGRSPRLGVTSPYADRLVVLDIAELSHGAGTGIGNADATTCRVFEKYNFDATYVNGITSNDPESIRIPAVMPGDAYAIKMAIATLMGERKYTVPRIVWIQNTSEMEHMYISSSLLEATLENPVLTVSSPLRRAVFNADNYFLRFEDVQEEGNMEC